ncbi:MAG TPA: alpha/beta hydrolase [Actinophytocola sp.]|nr:alpha/beta hydrolase [Actinophytocola sp.]
MIDPEIPYGKLASGDAGRIEAVAEPIGSAMSALTGARSAIDGGGSTAASGWEGEAATGFASRAELSGTATSAAHDRLGQAKQIVEAAAGAYRTMRGAADNAIQVWRTRPSGMDAAATEALAARVNEALGGVRDGYEQTLRAYAGALGRIAPAFAETAAGEESWASTAPVTGLTVPPPGSDPTAVAQWWAGLSETERDQLRATRFEELGRLRGLPADVLDDANRRRMEVDRARFAADQAELDARIDQRAEELGIDPADEGAMRRDPALADLLDQRQDVTRQLENAEAAEQRVAEATEASPDGAYVLSYDPVGPGAQEGLLAVAYGNPDLADNVAVVVPGTGSTLTSFPNGDASALRAQMDAAAPDARNVTIAWLGYDAPTWDMSVATPDNAIDGGERLVSDVEGYRASAQGDQHVTVVGHSYGSVTVGYAGMNGLAADDIAFIGSPGVGASDVDQLSSGDGHVWAGTTEHDPVVQGTSGDWFTADGSSTGPYDESFGANQFGAADGGHAIDAHVGYYDEGSESLRNLGNIATGNYEAVSEARWQDQPLPPELPGSDLPIVGPAIDAAASAGRETVDIVEDVGGGLLDTGGHLLDGDWDSAWNELTDTGGELVNDTADTILGTAGDAVEGGRDIYENTLGRLF